MQIGDFRANLKTAGDVAIQGTPVHVFRYDKPWTTLVSAEWYARAAAALAEIEQREQHTQEAAA